MSVSSAAAETEPSLNDTAVMDSETIEMPPDNEDFMLGAIRSYTDCPGKVVGDYVNLHKWCREYLRTQFNIPVTAVETTERKEVLELMVFILNDFYTKHQEVLHNIIENAVRRQQARNGTQLTKRDFNFPPAATGPSTETANYFEDSAAWDVVVADRQREVEGKKAPKVGRASRTVSGQSSGALSSVPARKNLGSAGPIMGPLHKTTNGPRELVTYKTQKQYQASRGRKETVTAAFGRSSTSEHEDANETTPDSSPSTLLLSGSPNNSDNSTDVTDPSPYVEDLNIEETPPSGPAGDKGRNLDPRIQSNLARTDFIGCVADHSGIAAQRSREESSTSDSDLHLPPQQGVMQLATPSMTIPAGLTKSSFGFLDVANKVAPATSEALTRDDAPRLSPLEKLSTGVVFHGQSPQQPSLLLQGDSADNPAEGATGAVSVSTRSGPVVTEGKSTAGPSTLHASAADTASQITHTPRRSSRLEGRPRLDYALTHNNATPRLTKKRKAAVEDDDL